MQFKRTKRVQLEERRRVKQMLEESKRERIESFEQKNLAKSSKIPTKPANSPKSDISPAISQVYL